jgi:hypothetical protein
VVGDGARDGTSLLPGMYARPSADRAAATH